MDIEYLVLIEDDVENLIKQFHGVPSISWFDVSIDFSFVFQSFCFCSVAVCVLVPNKVLFWIYFLKLILTTSVYQEKLILTHFCCHVMNNSCGIFFHWECRMCTDISFLFITFSLVFEHVSFKYWCCMHSLHKITNQIHLSVTGIL